MRSLALSLSSLAMLLSAVVLAPALYLEAQVAGDPEGLVSSMLRLAWAFPVVWIGGAWFASENSVRNAKGLLWTQGPAFLVVAAIAVVALGFPLAGKHIVSHPTPTSREDALRAEAGEPVIIEADLGLLMPLAQWAAGGDQKQAD